MHKVHSSLGRLILAVGLTAGICGCSTTNDTINSLVDLAATTTGSLVEIFVRSAADALLAAAAPNQPDLSAPLSQQSH